MTTTEQATSVFLDAARGASTPRAPIWLMRQAGRYLPEYRALKERHSFWEMCRTPEIAAEVTVQPLRRFPLDAAIIFSDIMTPLPPMGVPVDFAPGPVIRTPVRTAEDVARLAVPPGAELAPFVGEAIRLVRERIPVPVIGFAGAPLTVAGYAVQGAGSADYAEFRSWLRREPLAAHGLLDKLAAVTAAYLREQIAAGAGAVQLFDSWAGIHDRRVYATFGMPYARRVLDELADTGVPRIYLAVGASHLYPQIARLPAEVISVDWRQPLDVSRAALPGKALQGNLDPTVMLTDRETVLAAGRQVLRDGLGGAHIFNLGHGVLPGTPPDNVARLVDLVHEFPRDTDTATHEEADAEGKDGEDEER
ncbi:uroporphyrinogen decarboxylase [Actinomadura pelletieri DSM 43383]|uniref:Uroporphyrinogen decarboxylase n=1 Tax=Actinomadura pelletieri DSM 43383 TaxID=1120940 RepID=A0A495QU36_9ACTN|nr:uroporphyrinogen decarboxylase [Actinomadura pelletieri]RKS77034.1 uroporphyrinogen decarboxylase [Actinomadura pelletieri DSM 43383]